MNYRLFNRFVAAMMVIMLDSASAQRLIINEVMFDPVGVDYYDEFIEIYNLDSIPVDLRGMALDINGSIDSIAAINGQWQVLLPGAYGLILDRGYIIDHKSFTYENLIPTATLRFTIKDASFGKSGLANTTPNLIKLISAQGDTLCRVATTPNQSSGYSDEKIIIDGPDTPGNWGNSRCLYGTPGYKNSIVPKDHDVAVAILTLNEPNLIIHPGQPVTFSIKVKNCGLLTCSDFELLFGEDLNGDSVLTNGEVHLQTHLSLLAGDSLSLQPVISGFSSGEHAIICYLVYEEDEEEENNFKALPIKVAYPKGCLAINEFMYYPRTDGGGEWVELLNISSDSVNLKNWTLGDNATRALLTKSDFWLPPQAYLVVANDSSFLSYWQKAGFFLDSWAALPALNNTSDSIVIRDLCGQVIDSLKYASNWGYKQGVSLERKNPYRFSTIASNWGLSKVPEGATPGATNSLMLKRFNLTIDSIAVCSNQTPLRHGDPVDIKVFICNAGLEELSNYGVQLSVSKKSSANNLILFDTTIFNNQNLAPYSTVNFAIKINAIAGGVYQIAARSLSSLDEDSTDDFASHILKVGYPPGQIVVNEIMYQPAANTPEWFELYNIGDLPIDLNGWCFRKAHGSWQTLLDTTFILEPQQYLIVAANLNFYQMYPEWSGNLLIPPTFPSLNNTSDSLFLKDAANQIHEIIRYDSKWGGKENVTIERINPYTPALSSPNWGSSIAPTGATPGTINSIALRPYDLTIDTLYYNSERLCDGDDVIINLRVRNCGLATVNDWAVNLRISPFHTSDPNNILGEVLLSKSIPILPGEIIAFSHAIPNIAGGAYQVQATIKCPADENFRNDTLNSILRVGYPVSTIVISEILYKPESGESEWFEIYNLSQRPVDLNQWQLRDALGSWRLLADSSVQILPGQFAVVAAQPSFLRRYPDFNGLVIFPSSFPSLHNTSDSLLIRDATGIVIDSAYYRDLLGSKSGISLEKTNLAGSGLSLSNWVLSSASEGATPGLRNSRQRWNYDLALQFFTFHDTLTAANLPASFSVKVVNRGLQVVNDFSISIFEGERIDSLTVFSKLVQSQNINALIPPDSSLLISGNILAPRCGRIAYLCQAVFSSDEYQLDNQKISDLIVAFPQKAVTINEFLAYPAANQVEFVELVSLFDSPIDLGGWQLWNHLKATTLPNFELKPREYIVIAGDSAFFNYFACPAPVIILPKWLGLNNVADKIEICDLSGRSIDSLYYNADWKIPAGYSMEKILPEYVSDQIVAWQKCASSYRATPGALNSVTPLLYDLGLDSLRLTNSKGDMTTIFSGTLFYKNYGQENCPGALLEILHKYELHTAKIYNDTLPTLAAGKTGVKTIDLGNFPSGRHLFTAHITWHDDQNGGNDSLNWALDIAYPSNALLLSEIMPYPFDKSQPGVSNAEYIELFNPNPVPINLSNWFISDDNTARKQKIPEGYSISPNGYFVIASDSSIFNFSSASALNTIVLPGFPSLNNDEDAVYLYDATAQIIDEVHYLSTWDIEKGCSLERINRRNPNNRQNWRSSVALQGGTPGLPNSVAQNKPLASVGLEVTPKIFTPNGDKNADEICFQYRLPFPSALLTIEIYDLEGRLINRPAKNLLTTAEGAIFWNGDSEWGGKARIGLYLVRCSACDTNSPKSVEYVTSFVLFK